MSLMRVHDLLNDFALAHDWQPPKYWAQRYIKKFGWSDNLIQQIWQAQPDGTGGCFNWTYSDQRGQQKLSIRVEPDDNPDGEFQCLDVCGASVMSCYTPEEFAEALLYYKLMKSLLEPLGADYIYGCADKWYQVENPWDEQEIIRASFLFRRHGWNKQVWHLENEQVIDGDLPFEEWPPRFIYRHLDTGEWFESDEECPQRVLT